MSAKPNILIITTSPTFSPARLAMALAKFGCAIEAVCPPSHPLRNTRAVRRTYTYNCLFPLRSLAKGIDCAKPDLVVPSDDTAAQNLHDLYQREQRRNGTGSWRCVLIERSIGAHASFQLVYARAALLELARSEGIRVPKTEVLANAEDLDTCAAQIGFPMVLKADGTSGGDGVRIVRTMEEAKRAYRALEAPPLFARAVKRVLIDQDMALLWPSLLRRRYIVNAQGYVAGREATCAVACWEGRLLASIHFEVLSKQDWSGPSTVVRRIDNAEMYTAAEKIVHRLGLSGLHGFDFVLEAESGAPYLIEMNPRATQVGHLSLGPGSDLPSALSAAIYGTEAKAAPKITDKDTIALFPQEWLRDAASAYLQSAYHDVPWEEPEFLLLCMRRRWKQKAWYSQLRCSQVFSRVLPHL